MSGNKAMVDAIGGLDDDHRDVGDPCQALADALDAASPESLWALARVASRSARDAGVDIDDSEWVGVHGGAGQEGGRTDRDLAGLAESAGKAADAAWDAFQKSGGRDQKVAAAWVVLAALAKLGGPEGEAERSVVNVPPITPMETGPDGVTRYRRQGGRSVHQRLTTFPHSQAEPAPRRPAMVPSSRSRVRR
jgi:hypothetical protein